MTDDEFRNRVLAIFKFGETTDGQIYPALAINLAPGLILDPGCEVLKTLIAHPRPNTGSTPDNLRYLKKWIEWSKKCDLLSRILVLLRVII